MTEFIDMGKDEAFKLWDELRAGGWAFKSYFKYNFSFISKVNPNISVSIGGNSDDIYKEDIQAEMDFKDRELSYFNSIYDSADPKNIRFFSNEPNW